MMYLQHFALAIQNNEKIIKNYTTPKTLKLLYEQHTTPHVSKVSFQ
uniref:Uncharacterized protein n=1 Tax=Anguilla anguilla TaxID=7936 RepID=A0A0E9TMF8_ANGAN